MPKGLVCKLRQRGRGYGGPAGSRGIDPSLQPPPAVAASPLRKNWQSLLPPHRCPKEGNRWSRGITICTGRKRRARKAQSTTGVNLGAAPAVPGPQHPGRSQRPKRLNRTPRIVFRAQGLVSVQSTAGAGFGGGSDRRSCQALLDSTRPET
jgi:hypothetical protein